MKKVIITNNPLVVERFSDKNVEFYEVDYINILEKVRNKVHSGTRLLTHPLSGSIKPNETPYKTVVIEEKKDIVDFDSLAIIEGSISTARKFLNDKKTPCWNEKVLKDFQVIDLSLIEGVIMNKML